MNEEKDILEKVLEAQKNSAKADEFIRQYMPFIRSETAKFIKRIPMEGLDDELSIAMFAFYESLTAYDKSRGPFLRLAAFAIKNRLIDYYRKEKRHSGILSLDEPVNGDEEVTLIEKIDSGKDNVNERALSIAAKEEIETYSKELSEFDLSLSDVADCCPKQKKTLDACIQALEYAKANPELIESLLKEHKLPIARLCEGTGIERKTLERHRKYVVAIILAYTNGFEIIRGHLQQMKKKEVERT